MTDRLSLFASVPPGLESLAAAEFFSLGFQPATPAPGGVELRGTLAHLYRANLQSRTASRILLRVGEFHAVAFDELRRHAADLPWENFLVRGQPVAFNVTAHKSRLYHTGALEQRLAEAIGQRLGRQPPLAKEGQLIVARVVHDLCTMSVDTSGELLHRRGYRLATAKAPLRENLAAAVLRSSGWPANAPLLDPFCGAGTIPIEAALLARKIPPGAQRRFAFENFPDFDSEAWQAERERALAAQLPAAPAPILASDRDAGAIEAAQANAERAGVESDVHFSVRALSDVEPPGGPGHLVTNPPYGARVSESADLRNLFAALGAFARARLSGWTISLLAPHASLPAATGMSFQRTISFDNGGIRVGLWQATVE